MSSSLESHVGSFESSPSHSRWLPLARTGDERAALYLRIVLGAVMFPHGAQKAFGWFGWGGLSNTLTFFHEALHVPHALGLLVVATELVAAVALVAGALTRVA